MAEETTAIVEAPPEATESPAQEAPKETKSDVTLDKAMEVFGDTLTYGLGKKKKVAPPADTPKESDTSAPKELSNEPDKKDKTEDEKKADNKVEPAHKTKPKSKPVQRQELDETRIAEIAAEAGARASTETLSRIEREKPKSTEKPVDADFKPPKDYVDQYETFKVMAKSKPDKYGSLVDDFKTFVKEEDDYIKSWKQTHSGEVWDSESDEHTSFYDRATPKYAESDFRKAEMAGELAEARKELRKEVLNEVEPKLKKLDELERTEALRALHPVVSTAERTAMGSILTAIDPAYEKFVDPAELAKLKDEDPVAFDIALDVGRDALPFVAEVTRLWNSNGAVKSNENNPLHQYINSYGVKMGELIKALPADDQLRDGLKFATWQEFAAMTPAQQGRHWILTDKELIERKLLDAQEIAKERSASETKKLEAWSKRKGLTQGNAQQSSPKPAADPKPEPPKPLPPRDSNGSPSVGSRTQVGPSATPAPSSQPAHMLDFATLFSGRSL